VLTPTNSLPEDSSAARTMEEVGGFFCNYVRKVQTSECWLKVAMIRLML
jgi:hypothetical protein